MPSMGALRKSGPRGIARSRALHAFVTAAALCEAEQ